MTEPHEELMDIAESLDRLVKRSRQPDIQEPLKKLEHAAKEVGKAWSGSWLGYQANVYYKDLKPKPPGAHFSQEWGLHKSFQNESAGTWIKCDAEHVKGTVRDLAGNPDLEPSSTVNEEAVLEFTTQKLNVTSIFEAHKDSADRFLKRLREDLEKLSILDKTQIITRIFQRSRNVRTLTKDTLALNQGIWTPPHFSLLSEALSIQHTIEQVADLAKISRQAGSHLSRQRHQQRQADAIGTNVFIGHGRSPLWRDLKDFIEQQLNLPADTFNRVPVAGVIDVARLSEMMRSAAVALLVVTGDDSPSGGEAHSRMNAVHEAGLFQGRLGFSRAIILLEDGCETFDGIAGLGAIRFPKGDIRPVFDEIREVLDREGVLSAGSHGSITDTLDNEV